MKKLLTIITLFVSSFFLFFLEDVKAYEYNIELNFSHINDDSLNFKNALENYLKDNLSYTGQYIIRYSSSLGYYGFALKDNSSFYVNFSSDVIRINFTNVDRFLFNSSKKISFSSNYPSANFDIFTNNTYDPLLYHNFNISPNRAFNINYIYENFSYIDSSDTNNRILSLYDIYLKYQEYLGNDDLEHKEEIEKVESFYTIIIEKLSYLANEIASNYIYLAIIVIFILIFVFLLIFRRFL